MAVIKNTRKKKMTLAECARADFVRAGKCGKLIRDSFSKLLFNLHEPHLSGRLLSQVHNVLKTDAAHEYGSLTVATGDIDLLEGFEFNQKKRLPKLFNGNFSVTINRSKGECVVDIPVFDPVYNLKREERATHFRMVAAAAALDFDKLTSTTSVQEGEYLDIHQRVTLSLPMTVPVKTKLPILVVLAIEFHRQIGSRYHLLHRDGAKSLTIVKAEKV